LISVITVYDVHHRWRREIPRPADPALGTDGGSRRPLISLSASSRRYGSLPRSARWVGMNLEQPHTLAPMSTTEFDIDLIDSRGGPGANVIAEWSAANGIGGPLIEG
jgi:Protein of unknown function (DUF3124)